MKYNIEHLVKNIYMVLCPICKSHMFADDTPLIVVEAHGLVSLAHKECYDIEQEEYEQQN